MMKLKELNDPTYRGYRVNNGKDTEDLPYYPKILDRIIDQINNLLSHYSRIDVVRIDTKIPNNLGATILQKNNLVSQFIDKLKKKLSQSKWGCHNKVAHGWVFEIGDLGYEHHHLFLAFKHRFRNIGKLRPKFPAGLCKLLRDCAREVFGGKLYISKLHIINRNNQDEINKCIEHLSYLAKTRTKHFGTDETHKRFGFSQIKPKEITRKNRSAPDDPRRASSATPYTPRGHSKKNSPDASWAA